MFLNSLIFNLRELVEKSPAKRDKLIFIPLIFCGLFIIVGWILVLMFFWSIMDYVILHYNIYFGISSLGRWPMLLLMPASGLLVIIVNYFLSLYFYLKDKLLSYFLVMTALAYNALVLAALILIIYINL